MCEEDIDATPKQFEEEPKMFVYASERTPRLFRRICEIISREPKGHLYVAFHMGSVNLDISNVNNILDLDYDFVEIFNAENGELSLIKTDEITGFIFEPEQVCNCEDEEYECGCKEE